MAGLLVGRGVEAAVLRGLITELPERSAAVVVRGEAGIGKTMLVQSVLDEYAGDGVRVLRGACAPMSGAIAYGGLGATMAAALSQSTESTAGDLARRSASHPGRRRSAAAQVDRTGDVAAIARSPT